MRGDIYFAYIAEMDTFDPVVHGRLDEEIETCVLRQDEDAFATFELTVAPRQGGTMDPTKAQWAFLSWENADGDLVLLAKGKLDALPLTADAETATLTFTCAPSDWEEAQLAVLQATKSEAHWDPLLVALESRDDPVEILDGQSRIVSFHPATHEPQLHDIFGVGLPLIDIGLNWFDDDSGTIRAEIVDPPVRAVEITVTASWTQKLSGSFDATDDVKEAFDEHIPNTLTPDDLENRWPRNGDGIGNDNGYSVRSSSLTRAYPVGQPAKAGPFQVSSDVYNYITDSNLTAPIARNIEMDRIYYDCELGINWSAEQARRETVVIRLTSGAQDWSLGSGGVEKIAVECQDVTVDYLTPEWQPGVFYAVGAIVKNGSANWKRLIEGVSEATWAADFSRYDMTTFPPTLRQTWERQSSDQSPIGGLHKDRYFPTERGHQTLLAALMKGRAFLSNSMRCVEFTVSMPAEDAIAAGLWVGSVVRLEIPADRIAIEGNTVEGKVSSWQMTFSADESDHDCEVTISCAVGSGKTTAVPGGSLWASLTGETWDRVPVPDFSGLTPKPMATGGIVQVYAENQASDQIDYIDARDYSPPDRVDKDETDPAKIINDVPTNLVFILVPLEAQDEMLVEGSATVAIPFEGPRQVDLGGA